jgi:hypothetical protein
MLRRESLLPKSKYMIPDDAGKVGCFSKETLGIALNEIIKHLHHSN